MEQVSRGLFLKARAASRPRIAIQGSWSKFNQNCSPKLCGASHLRIVPKVCGAIFPRIVSQTLRSKSLKDCPPRHVEQVFKRVFARAPGTGSFSKVSGASRPRIVSQGLWSKSPKDCFPHLAEQVSQGCFPRFAEQDSRGHPSEGWWSKSSYDRLFPKARGASLPGSRCQAKVRGARPQG